MLECEPAWLYPSRPVARMPDPKIAGLIERMLGGDRLALARVITHVENNTASVPAIIKATHRSGRESYARRPAPLPLRFLRNLRLFLGQYLRNASRAWFRGRNAYDGMSHLLKKALAAPGYKRKPGCRAQMASGGLSSSPGS